ncbi:MAG: hypothetical protein WAT79_01725 [Saprospiraceae bacterium]
MISNLKSYTPTFQAVLTLVFLILMNSCDSSSDKNSTSISKEISEDLDEAKDDFQDAKKEYIKKFDVFKLEVEEIIAENELKIKALKEEIKKQNKKDTKAKEKKLKELEATNRTFKDRLNKFKDEGENKWESFRRELQHDMDHLGDAIKDLTEDNAK